MPAASWPLRDPCAALLLAPPRHKTVTSPSNSLSIQTEKRDPANQPLERCNECHCYRPTRSRSHTLSAIIEFLHDCLSSTLLQLFIFFSLAFHRRFFSIFSLPPPPPPLLPCFSSQFSSFPSFPLLRFESMLVPVTVKIMKTTRRVGSSASKRRRKHDSRWRELRHAACLLWQSGAV